MSSGDDRVLVKSQVWKGQRIRNLAYENQPWEIEAYNLESKIVEEYKNAE